MEAIIKLIIICYCLIAYAYTLGICKHRKKEFELLPFLMAPLILLYEIWLDIKVDFTQAHQSLDSLFIDIVDAYNENRHSTMIELYHDLDIDELQQFYQFCVDHQIVYKLTDIRKIVDRYNAK